MTVRELINQLEMLLDKDSEIWVYREGLDGDLAACEPEIYVITNDYIRTGPEGIGDYILWHK